jgi:pilus assembly protein Flp/PilA
MKQLLISFARHDSGASAVEYALMVALIAVVIVGAVAAVGGSANTLFEKAASLLP